MNLTLLDWSILVIAVIAIRLVSLSTRKHMKSVADFLSANRSAGRYLLTIASQMGGIGVVSVVALYEVMHTAGLSPNWWANLSIPATIIILLSGWVYYRFRETRALTLAQFFEMRYNRKFRINAGILCWLSGILNFGIFPGVAARFFVYYCGLPEHFHLLSLPWELNTYVVVMAIDMTLALSFVLMGGQISVMITECVQGMFCTIAFLVISMVVVAHFTWPELMRGLEVASKPDASMLNPFHTSGVKDFNVWYYLIAVSGAFYGYMSWQGTQGFNSSARTPHEQKMGGIIGGWRQIPQTLMITLLGLAALAVLRLPQFADQAAVINSSLAGISNTTIRGEMTIPIAIVHLLPVGIKGLFGTIMLFISFTCHDSYMHSWGSIFVQDVVMPLKRKSLSPHEHITLLRLSIFGVALFAFVFSWAYPPSQKILMFFAATATIWIGSGAAIVGGLYWKKGTTAGAYAALNAGCVLGLASTAVPVIWQNLYHREFPINSQYILFFTMLTCIALYYVVSLLTCREEFDLDRMLHRGVYADSTSEIAAEEAHISAWQKVVGITKEFSKGDRFLAVLLVTWNMANFLWFVVFSVANLAYHVSDLSWATYWKVTLILNLAMSVPFVVWFTVGGYLDIKALYKLLDSAVPDHTDDGRVADNSKEACKIH